MNMRYVGRAVILSLALLGGLYYATADAWSSYSSHSYSSPSRSYSSPSYSSRSYSSPSRSYSSPSYSSPSKTYSSPSYKPATPSKAYTSPSYKPQAPAYTTPRPRDGGGSYYSGAQSPTVVNHNYGGGGPGGGSFWFWMWAMDSHRTPVIAAPVQAGGYAGAPVITAPVVVSTGPSFLTIIANLLLFGSIIGIIVWFFWYRK